MFLGYRLLRQGTNCSLEGYLLFLCRLLPVLRQATNCSYAGYGFHMQLLSVLTQATECSYAGY